MDPSFLAQKFAAGLPYGRYLATGTDEQRRRWSQVYEVARLTPEQNNIAAAFARDMKVLTVSGIWCGDCVQQCPLLQRIAEANAARIDLRFVDRDEHRDLAEQIRLNAGDRVPVVLFLAEDFELCALYGDRTLSRYRALATRFLGPARPTGIAGPDPEELAATQADWFGEFERIQWMLRLSARLRQKHGD
jgi:thioredoxin-like negative regulator of GroEL